MRRKLFFGAITLLIIIIWLVDFAAEYAKMEVFNSLIPPTTPMARTIAIIFTIYLISLFAFALYISIRPNPQIKLLFEKLTIQAYIPGFFFLSLSPVIVGIFLILVTGLVNWGLWLSCLGIPLLFCLLLVSLRQQK